MSPQVKRFIELMQHWAAVRVERGDYDEFYDTVFQHVVELLESKEDLVFLIIGANASGELGSAQTTGSLATYYGKDQPVLTALIMLAADLVADEVINALGE